MIRATSITQGFRKGRQDYFKGRRDGMNFDEFRKELEELGATGSLTVADIDIDYFAEINHKYGRACGDKVITVIEDVIRKSMPEKVLMTRFGDEFYVYTTEYPLETMFMEIQEARKTIAESSFECEGVEVKFTVSGSVGELNRNANSVEKLLNLVSEGMRNGKLTGRNQLTFAPMEKEQKMVLKSSYYLKSELEGLVKLAKILERTESSLLREALDDLLRKYEL